MSSHSSVLESVSEPRKPARVDNNEVGFFAEGRRGVVEQPDAHRRVARIAGED